MVKQDTTRKERQFSVLEFELSDNNEYKMEAIQDSAVYAKKRDGHLPRLYYLLICKEYPEEKNTWESSLVVMHLQKIISTFYKDHLEKWIVTLVLLDSVLLMVKLII